MESSSFAVTTGVPLPARESWLGFISLLRTDVSRNCGLCSVKTGEMEKTWDELIEEDILEVYDKEYAKGILRVSDGKESEIAG